jgi:16S rRNA (cytidine1402-2'-O)-methyltransferase
MIFFESPHRIHESLAAAADVLGPTRQASVSRELTKKFEQTVRGTLAELTTWAAEEPRGEIVLVVSGAAAEAAETADLLSLVLELAADGTGLKQAAAEVAAAHPGVSKNDLYNQALQARGKRV